MLDFYLSFHFARYGPLVKLRIFDDVVYVTRCVCADPESFEAVTQIPDKRLPKEVFGCKALANQGVFIADGQRWEFARHALQAQLTPEAIDELVPIFAERCHQLEAVISANPEQIDIFAWVEKVTMDTICNVGFGHDLKCMESA
ncbi:Putative bifunctional P-450/NADPH-P450 reductase 1, partial [Durusdinium trenchii]